MLPVLGPLFFLSSNLGAEFVSTSIRNHQTRAENFLQATCDGKLIIGCVFLLVSSRRSSCVGIFGVPYILYGLPVDMLWWFMKNIQTIEMSTRMDVLSTPVPGLSIFLDGFCTLDSTPFVNGSNFSAWPAFPALLAFLVFAEVVACAWAVACNFSIFSSWTVSAMIFASRGFTFPQLSISYMFWYLVQPDAEVMIVCHAMSLYGPLPD